MAASPKSVCGACKSSVTTWSTEPSFSSKWLMILQGELLPSARMSRGMALVSTFSLHSNSQTLALRIIHLSSNFHSLFSRLNSSVVNLKNSLSVYAESMGHHCKHGSWSPLDVPSARNQALVISTARLLGPSKVLRGTLCRRTLDGRMYVHKVHLCAVFPAGVMLQSGLHVFLCCTCRGKFQRCQHELSIHVLSSLVSVPCSV